MATKWRRKSLQSIGHIMVPSLENKMAKLCDIEKTILARYSTKLQELIRKKEKNNDKAISELYGKYDRLDKHLKVDIWKKVKALLLENGFKMGKQDFLNYVENMAQPRELKTILDEIDALEHEWLDTLQELAAKRDTLLSMAKLASPDPMYPEHIDAETVKFISDELAKW